MDFYTFIVCLSIILPFWYFVYLIVQFITNHISQGQFDTSHIETLLTSAKNIFESYGKLKLHSLPF